MHALLRTGLLVVFLVGSGLMFAADPQLIERGSAEERQAREAWVMTPDPALPDVLVIGDSISIGYTLAVRRALAGVANVYRPMNKDGLPFNCGDTARGLKNLDTWLGAKSWRVIHFNFGLHDLKYLDDKGKLVGPEQGRQVSTHAQYEANLRRLTSRLKATGARVIWATTTPVPDGTVGRVAGDEKSYNETARLVMRENDVLIDDLWASVASDLPRFQLHANVHFNDQGSLHLAESAVRTIRAALERPEKP